MPGAMTDLRLALESLGAMLFFVAILPSFVIWGLGGFARGGPGSYHPDDKWWRRL